MPPSSVSNTECTSRQSTAGLVANRDRSFLSKLEFFYFNLQDFQVADAQVRLISRRKVDMSINSVVRYIHNKMSLCDMARLISPALPAEALLSMA